MVMLKLRNRLALGVLALMPLTTGLAQDGTFDRAETHREMRFQVFLNDKPIGYHTFSISRAGETEVVEIAAEFDVSVLFVPVYSYRHRNTEVWREGCLMSIDSQTDDNGEYFRVNGERTERGFSLLASDQSQSLPTPCVMTFAYWNPQFLTQSSLLNAQTGDYLKVEINPLEANSVQLPDSVIPASGYRVRSADGGLELTVWYTQDSGRWLALESVLENGRKLRYVPASKPGPLASHTAKPDNG